MPTAVFDFDGTLAYMPSSLVWALKIPLVKKFLFAPMYLFEKLTGKSAYQKKVFEWLVGTDVGETVERMKRVPAVPEGVRYFKELDAKGFRMVVMSYSPATFINVWMQAQGLSADLICPDFVVSRGKIKAVSDDDVTQLYLEDTKNAKKKIAEMLNIHPSVSVGDNKKRDAVGGKYKGIKELQTRYKSKPIQVFKNLDKIF